MAAAQVARLLGTKVGGRSATSSRGQWSSTWTGTASGYGRTRSRVILFVSLSGKSAFLHAAKTTPDAVRVADVGTVAFSANRGYSLFAWQRNYMVGLSGTLVKVEPERAKTAVAAALKRL